MTSTSVSRVGSARRLRSLAVFILAAQPFATAGAADWQLVGIDAVNNRYSVDVSSLSRTGGLVRTEVRTEYATPRDDAQVGQRIFAALDTLVVDCSTASFAVENRDFVTADGKRVTVVATARDKLSLKPAAAGSMSEAIVRFACRPGR